MLEKLFEKKKLFLVIIMLLLLIIGIYYIRNSRVVVVSKYSIDVDLCKKANEKNRYNLRIVQLTDLHKAEFGDQNEELISRIKALEPDLIVMTGDMLNEDEADTGIISSLIGGLKTVAPVYYSMGNHEIKWEEQNKNDLNIILEKAGAIVLDDEYKDFDINGVPIRLGGFYGYYPSTHMLPYNDRYKEKKFCDEFENTTRYKILLCHIPTSWVDWNYINDYSVDLVFCGHYHGGVIHFPIIDRGLYAPYVGWFPKNTKGMFKGTKGICILSSGLGTEYAIPRINNPPEIVVADILFENCD